jgi:hypothetical protein
VTKKRDVQRPFKRSEYIIQFGTTNAAKGWKNLVSTKQNAVVDAWDWLTKTPGVLTGLPLTKLL